MKRIPVLPHFLTLLAVLFGWVLFRAEDLSAALSYLRVMFGGGVFSNPTAVLWLKESAWCLGLGVLFSCPLAKIFSQKTEKNIVVTVLYPAALILALLFVISYLIKGGYNPFIYFNF